MAPSDLAWYARTYALHSHTLKRTAPRNSHTVSLHHDMAAATTNGSARHGDSDGVASSSSSSTPYAIEGPTSPQSSLIASGQKYVVFPTFTLESGIILHNIPLAYKTWGTLDADKKNNALVVCHALTGSADVEDWWGPLLGPGKLFDPTRFFIVCSNVLGSPYGSAGPCTRKDGHADQADAQWNGEGWWGPEFPATTVRDDVRITKMLLDFLHVEQIAAVVGGSMGGMSVLEWPLMYPVRFPDGTPSQVDDAPDSVKSQQPYIRALVPLATSARHSAWCISWAEAQRQSIYSDPMYDHGYYAPSNQPRAGLSAARMAALLTYRSRESFENRFGRRIGGPNKGGGKQWKDAANHVHHPADAHNEGNLSPRIHAHSSSTTNTPIIALPPPATQTTPFSAQSYLRYQGDKFVNRFDANCYVHLTRKMDAHDVARGRAHWGSGAANGHEPVTAEPPIEATNLELKQDEVTIGEKRLPREGEEDDEALERVLSLLSANVHRQGAAPPSVLIVSVESDGLFAPPEQELLHSFIKGSTIVTIQSPDGHDGFLLEFEQINRHVQSFLRPILPDIYEGEGVGHVEWSTFGAAAQAQQVKESMSGEVEDLTRW